MHLFGLVLALALGPSKALIEPHLHLARTGRATTVSLDAGFLAPVDRAIPEVETLGAILSAGVVLPGELHLGVDGNPSMPFLSPFFYAQEIRASILREGQVDPMSLAGQLMVTARIDF